MTIENGRKRILRGYRKNRSDWAVLLVDHHEGYLSWADYERNQRLIADNANGKGMMVRGAVRKGEALLVGLLRCHLVAWISGCGRIEPYPCSGLCDADVLRASQLQHTAQHVGRDGHLGRLSPVGLEA